MAEDTPTVEAAEARQGRRFDRIATPAVTLTVLLAHGVSLLDPGRFWDGWPYTAAVVHGDWNAIYIPFRDAAYPLIGVIIWFLGRPPGGVWAFRVTSLLMIWIVGIVVYRIGVMTGRLRRREALAVAMLASVAPVFQVTISAVEVPVVVCYGAFFVAVLLGLYAERGQGWSRVVLRALALALFIVAFVWRSFLVLYLGFFALLFWYATRDAGRRDLRSLVRFTLRHLDYAAWPFLYWFGNKLVFPNRGIYADSNAFRLGIRPFFGAWRLFAQYHVVQAGREVWAVATSPTALMLAALVATLAWWSARRERPLEAAEVRASGSLFAWGIVLVALAALPYVVTGTGPFLDGWMMRHAFLTPVPAALVAVALLRWVAGPGPLDRPRAVVASVLFAVLLAGGVAVSVQSYVMWHARWLKDSSVMANLAATPGADRYSVFWIDDGDPKGPEFTRFYEWSSMFEVVWGTQTHVGLLDNADSRDWLKTGRSYWTASYRLADFDPNGPQARLTIDKGPNDAPDFAMVWRDLVLRATDAPGADAFLKGVTSVSVQPVAGR